MGESLLIVMELINSCLIHVYHSTISVLHQGFENGWSLFSLGMIVDEKCSSFSFWTCMWINVSELLSEGIAKLFTKDLF